MDGEKRSNEINGYSVYKVDYDGLEKTPEAAQYNTGYNMEQGQTEDKEKLLAQRNATIQKFKLLGFAELIYGIIFLGIAIAQLGVAAQGEFGWPLLNVGPLVAAVMSILAGCLMILFWKKGEECKSQEDTPKDLKQLFWGIWTVNHLINCGFIGWGGSFCWMSVAACTNESSDNHRFCLPDKDANLALAATLGVFCILVQAFIIPTYYLFWKNRKAFHIGGGKCCPCC